MAREESNMTREKIAFGRLRHLRSLIERRFPEVDEFDAHIRDGQCPAGLCSREAVLAGV